MSCYDLHIVRLAPERRIRRSKYRPEGGVEIAFRYYWCGDGCSYHHGLETHCYICDAPLFDEQGRHLGPTNQTPLPGFLANVVWYEAKNTF